MAYELRSARYLAADGTHTVYVYIINGMKEVRVVVDTQADMVGAYANGFVPDGKPVTGLFTAGGHRATIGDFTYEVSENFDQWVLWNGDAAQKFVSIEPQCGAVNALNSGAGLRILEPHRTETFHTCIHNPAR